MLDKAECYLREEFQRKSPSKFLRLIDSKLAPFISGSFDLTRHCDRDCVNSELIFPRRKNPFKANLFMSVQNALTNVTPLRIVEFVRFPFSEIVQN